MGMDLRSFTLLSSMSFAPNFGRW